MKLVQTTKIKFLENLLYYLDLFYIEKLLFSIK